MPRLYRYTQGGTTRESLEEEGANTIKNIHNEKAPRPLALGLEESVNSGAVTRILWRSWLELRHWTNTTNGQP